MTRKLEGKIALVTGGSSGIGLATAQRFVKEGAFVFITGRRQAELDKAAATLGEQGKAVRADASSLADLDRLFEQIGEEKGRLDVLFVNAGGGSFAPLGSITEEQYDQTFNTNVKGVLFTVQKALPLIPDGGSIILNASIVSIKGLPAFSVYSASKAAVRSFARVWTNDLKHRNIRVNVISPGPIETPGVDMRVVRNRKRAMVDGLIATHENRFAQTGVELIRGEGGFAAPGIIEVSLAGGDTRVLTATHIVISTGSRASIDPVPGLREAKPLTHVEALELGEVPEHLIVLGGGYIGLEFAQAMRRFGSRVTILERNQRLLHRGDQDVSEALERIFTAEGIRIVTGVKLNGVRGYSGEQVALQLEREGSSSHLTGSHLLVATGRTPNTDGIGLENAGVALTRQGFVQVNEKLETTAPGVFAVGDCAGSPHFTHIAFDDFRVVRDTMAGHPRATTGRLVPSCLFVDPELARVGLDESEARRMGISYRLVKLPMEAVLRAQTTGETEGFLKALIAEDDRILGFTALGASAGEMMAPVQLAMSAGLPYTALRDSVFTHPTFAEGLVYLFSRTPMPVG